MGEENLYFLIFTISGLTEYISMRIVFQRFLCLDEKPCTKQKLAIAIACYVACVYFFAWNTIHTTSTIIFVLSYILYYFKYLAILSVKNRITKTIPFFLFYYEMVVALLGQNTRYFWNRIGIIDVSDDVNIMLFEMIAGIFLALVIFILLICKKAWHIALGFSSLSIGQYVVFIALGYIGGFVQSRIYQLRIAEDSSKVMLEDLSILMILAIIISTIQSMVVIDRNNTLEEAMALLNEQMEKATEHYREIIQKDYEVKKFRHDIKNLLIALRSLIEEGKKDKAVAYMDEIQCALASTAKKYDTGNFMADAVLNSKNTKAAEVYTAIKFDGFVPVNRVKDIDMVVLLSNLLDNAIEACQKVEGNKVIRVDSVLKKNTWVLAVQNPTVSNVLIENNFVETTKKDKALHGFGLRNIEQVAAKYNGFMNIQCDNGVFQTRVTMNI